MIHVDNIFFLEKKKKRKENYLSSHLLSIDFKRLTITVCNWVYFLKMKNK